MEGREHLYTGREVLLVFRVGGFNSGHRQEGGEEEEEERGGSKKCGGGVGWRRKGTFLNSSFLKGPSSPFTVSQ